MRIVRSNKNGKIINSEIKYFGSSFSIKEQLLVGGIGSKKVIYVNGSDELDLLKRDVQGELVFLSFELLKNGIIARANCNQRIMNIGMLNNEIEFISLVGYRIKRTYKNLFGIIKDDIVHRGELQFKSRLKNNSYNFDVLAKDYKSITNYFLKKGIKDKFYHSISINIPEEENYTKYFNLI